MGRLKDNREIPKNQKTWVSEAPKFMYKINSNLFKFIFLIDNMAKVRIKLKSMDIDQLNKLCGQIKDLSSSAGIPISGPIPLPTRKLKITTRKSPCGEGTATFDNYEMRIHARVIDLPSDDRVLHQIMRLHIPRSVTIKMEMKD